MIDRALPLSLPRRLAASLLTALVVSVIGYAAVALAYFVGQGFAVPLATVFGYFAWPTLVAFVAIAVLAAAGGFRAWFLAVITGVVGAIVGVALGAAISLAQNGSQFTSLLLGVILATLFGLNVFFLLGLVIAAATVGRRVWLFVTRGSGPGATRTGRRIALVRLPAANLEAGLVTHIERTPIDADLADEQWDAYVAALTENGWTIVEVEPEPDMADSVFIEDAVVLFGKTAVLTNPGSESRRGEIAGAEEAVKQLGLGIQRITEPGTLDGGDVLKVGTTVYVGRGGRTNGEGIRQLRGIVGPLGYTVVAVPTTKVLHLKSAVTALPDGTVIGYLPNVDDAGIFDRFLAVPEEAGSHVVELGPETVLMATSAPLSAELIRELGYTVVTVDISEFEKLEGCVTCLSVRVR